MRGVIIYLLALLIAFTIYSCANITTPNGGPKDVKAPLLIESNPLNKQTNFKGKSIELLFSEDVKLNNAREQVIITPSPGKDTEFKVKGNIVTITPVKNWEDTTTYSLQFREGIQDITEGNNPKNLKLAFSTGPFIDSMSITGKVFDLLSGESHDNITVAIYKPDTFDIFKHAPNYFTKTDPSGSFKLENIKTGLYKIYAFDDKSKNLKAESRTERYGFLSREIQLFENADSLNIGLIKMDSRPLRLSTIRTIGNITRIRFSKDIIDYTIENENKNLDIEYAFGDTQTEVNIWCPADLTDSLQLKITATDSLETKVDSIFYIKRKGREVKETFRWSFSEPAIESESGKFITTLSYSKPITTINFDSIYIELDSVNKVNFSDNDLTIDELHKKITFKKEIDKTLFKAEVEPILKLRAGKGFLYTIDNDTSKRITSEIIIYWPERTGILHLETLTKQKNFIIQLLNSRGKVIHSILNASKYSFRNLNPEDYMIRIITDLNHNGKWDPGNYEKNIEPEPVTFYTTSDGKKKIPLRANFEIGPLILKF